MGEQRYLISDAAKQLAVEPHVLRYWEEELGMEIKRNEMGHRYYTEDDVRVLKEISKMRQEGYALKDIKPILLQLYICPDFQWQKNMPSQMNMGKPVISKTDVSNKRVRLPIKGEDILPVSDSDTEFRLEQFQEIMIKIIGRAIEINHEGLTRELAEQISNQVSQQVIKQMDYLIQENETHMEERFRKLDELLRNRQRQNAEAAATLEHKKRKRKASLFGRKR